MPSPVASRVILPPDGVEETEEPDTGVKVSDVTKTSEVVTRQSELEVIVTSFVPAAASAERLLLENASARATCRLCDNKGLRNINITPCTREGKRSRALT